MENNEVKVLIDNFKAYRDLLTPVQKNLNDFIGTYDAMKENIDKLNAAFGGDLKARLEDIFRQMSGQAEKAADLSARIDQLAGSATKYASEVNGLVSLFSKIEERLSGVNKLEGQAEQQIARLDAILEEKSKNYNLKELQKSLDNYNADVRKIGEFINKDVADTLMNSQNKLDAMKTGLDGIVKSQNDGKASIESLLKEYTVSTELLKKITEKQDVNEAYLFDILDRWADSRRVKIKK